MSSFNTLHVDGAASSDGSQERDALPLQIFDGLDTRQSGAAEDHGFDQPSLEASEHQAISPRSLASMDHQLPQALSSASRHRLQALLSGQSRGTPRSLASGATQGHDQATSDAEQASNAVQAWLSLQSSVELTLLSSQPHLAFAGQQDSRAAVADSSADAADEATAEWAAGSAQAAGTTAGQLVEQLSSAAPSIVLEHGHSSQMPAQLTGAASVEQHARGAGDGLSAMPPALSSLSLVKSAGAARVNSRAITPTRSLQEQTRSVSSCQRAIGELGGSGEHGGVQLLATAVADAEAKAGVAAGALVAPAHSITFSGVEGGIVLGSDDRNALDAAGSRVTMMSLGSSGSGEQVAHVVPAGSTEHVPAAFSTGMPSAQPQQAASQQSTVVSQLMSMDSNIALLHQTGSDAALFELERATTAQADADTYLRASSSAAQHTAEAAVVQQSAEKAQAVDVASKGSKTGVSPAAQPVAAKPAAAMDIDFLCPMTIRDVKQRLEWCAWLAVEGLAL